MKKIIAVTIVFALALLAGCGEKAEPIVMPANDVVTSIEVVTLGGANVDITAVDQIEITMEALREAAPTRMPSVNDRPTNVSTYGTVSINTAGEGTVVYYYDKDGKHYIEQPYRGIYELEEGLEDLLPDRN